MTESVIVTVRATKSYDIADVEGEEEDNYFQMKLQRNKDLKIIRELGFEVEVEDEQ